MTKEGGEAALRRYRAFTDQSVSPESVQAEQNLVRKRPVRNRRK